MSLWGTRTKASHEHGVVLIMVIGVLAMLFIVGSTLLIVARFERQTARTQADGRNLEAVGISITDPIIAQLREDLVGTDAQGEPYNDGWGNDDSVLADYADFPGYVGVGNPRNGDLLLSSIEPYGEFIGSPPVRHWYLPFATWAIDAVPPNSPAAPAPNAVRKVEVNLTGGPDRDATGDGIRDSADSTLFAQLAGMFGGSFQIELQVVPHGGMVLLDELTHDSLLLDVIHLRDIKKTANNHKDVTSTDLNNLWAALFGPAGVPVDPEAKAKEEGRFRRRFMLPPFLPTPPTGSDYADVAPDLVKLLPVTTGNASAASPSTWVTDPINHWWPFDTAVVDDPEKENDRWQALLTPGLGPTETTQATGPVYDAADDQYDRRRLLTLFNSDDILRRRRDEGRLAPAAIVEFGPFSAILNPPDASNPNAYGLGKSVVGGPDELLFNKPRLRTQFSLRDVLDRATGLGTERRALQLTAYYLAMIQHTTVPGSGAPLNRPTSPTDAELAEQLRTAAQLAVNTIDFADFDDPDHDGIDNHTPSYFEWGVGTPLEVRVVGVEKQPYITEAYVKAVASYNADAELDPANSTARSVWAVELYNPYTVDLDLTGYVLNIDTLATDLGDALGAATGSKRLSTGERVVFANTKKDPYDGSIPGYVNWPFDNSQPRVVAITTIRNDLVAPTPVQLERKPDGVLNLMDPGGVFPAGTPNFVVDRIDPGAATNVGSVGHWARQPSDADILAATGSSPLADTDYWRHTSLQRHKEPDAHKPVYWHFTLGVQKGFESALAMSTAFGLPVHDILDSGRSLPDASRYVAENDPDMNVPNLAPFPVLVSDAGVDSRTGGTLAFPTTGTLLLVTRYAHQPGDPTVPGDEKPVSVAATEVPQGSFQTDPITGNRTNPLTARTTSFAQMMQMDNGHLPVFDQGQYCQDATEGQGRPDVPWGQLVFDYFTALPLEELVRPLNLDGIGFGFSLGQLTPLVGLTEQQYRVVYGLGNAGAAALFGGYPLVEGWAESKSSTYGLGTRVFGRINIGVAPWRVLDGLPMLPDVLPIAGADIQQQLPVPELYAGEAGVLPQGQLDPAGYLGSNPVHDPAGRKLVNLLADKLLINNPPERAFPSVSPTLAKYMVSYREPVDNPNDPTKPPQRIPRWVDGVQAKWPESPPLPAPPAPSRTPSYVTVGELCDLLTRVKIPVVNTLDSNGDPIPLADKTIEELRTHSCLSGGTTIRPFSYLGYLQLVAPIVRLQDWATVKNHVFTIYAGIRSMGDPSIDLRTQVTVDRTPCLYNPQELPVRITWTEPVGYYNALGDE